MASLTNALHTHMLACVLALGLLHGAQTADAQFAPPQVGDDTLFLARFDEGLDADFAAGDATAEVNGAEIVEAGKWGGAVRLGDAEWLSFDPTGNLDMAEGTLTIWVKPDWQAPTERSHALLSMGLDGDPVGYFVLSQGWWESGGGGGRMYFVYDNQAYMHASTAAMMTLGEHLNEWHLLTLVWREGAPGQNSIYLDGRLVAQTSRDCQVRRPRTRLVVGDSVAAGMGSERWANALVDELAIYGRAMSADEAMADYRAQEPEWETVLAREWEWLRGVLAGPEPTFERDDEGRILESRALLDEGSGWVSKEATDERVVRMKAAGFNVYIPCVWHGRGTWWPSEIEAPQTELAEALGDADHDPLEYLVEQCHANGIEVHPWFCVSKRERDMHPELVEDGTPEKFFDMQRPEARDFIVALMLDVVRRYEVDGINLDYIRTGGLCTGPKCQAGYREKFGTELLDDVKKPTEDNWPNPNVVQWQNEAIADIVRRVAEEGRKLRPGLVVSIDGHIHPPTAAPSTDGRNEMPWIEAGWVDVVYNMDYGEHLNFARVDAVRAACAKPAAVVELPGNYEHNRDGKVVPRRGKLVADHIAYCQRKWPGNGVGLYLYSMLSDEQIRALRDGPFKEDAVPHWVR